MHERLHAKLTNYVTNGCVPNILFHGASGSGKNTLVRWFVDRIYAGNKENKQRYSMHVNCAFGKGIKFIRDSIKYFAKTNINLDGIFKIIILGNADKLTCDAQSALRRCIEQFSGSTRFFMITSERHRLLKPIISRFSEMYVPGPNLHIQTINTIFPPSRIRAEIFRGIVTDLTETNVEELTERLYINAFSTVDLVAYVEEDDIDAMHKYKWLMYYEKIRSEYRNESMLLYTMLHAYIFRTDPFFKLFI